MFICVTSFCSKYVFSNPSDVISIVCVLSFSSGNMYLLGVCTSVNTYFPGNKFSAITPFSFVVNTLSCSPFISSTFPTGFPNPSATSCPCSSVIVNLTPSIGNPFVSCFTILNEGVLITFTFIVLFSITVSLKLPCNTSISYFPST